MPSAIKEKDNIGLIISAVKKFGLSWVWVQGRSMLPLLADGTEIKIVKRVFREIKPCDWAAFTKNGNMLVHEVLFKSKKYLVSWGVNNKRTDGVIRENQVIGIIDKRQIWRRWHLIYLAEAKSLLHDFEMAGIKNLILKGPPWQIAKYGFLLDKPSADIDWLIDKNAYAKVRRILTRRGYRLRKQGWMKKRLYREKVPRVSEMTYTKRVLGDSVTVDLHLLAVREALTAWYKEPITHENMLRLTNELMANRKNERGFVVLSDTENLFYLCLNLMIHHGGRGVYQLASIARLIDRKKINWERVVMMSEKYRVAGYIYFPLLWAAKLFGIGIPVIKRLKPAPIRLWLAKLAVNRWTVMKPIPVSGWLPRNLGLLVVGYLRVVLSAARYQSGQSG